jgi:hypothetical protein
MTVFFIGGAARTGTSLAYAAICSDPALHPILPEAKYLRHLIRAHRYAQAAFETETREYFAHPEGLRAFTASQIAAICDALRLRFPETRHQAFKNPESTPHLPDFLDVLPDARAIVMVRDPRAVVASLHAIHDAQAALGIESWVTRCGRDAAALAHAYNSFYAPISNLADKHLYKRMLTLRYEDLVTSPGKWFERLADFTGLDIAGFAANPVWRNELRQDTSDAVTLWRGPLWGKAVSASRVDTWREALTEDEISAIGEVCAPYLAGFGYSDV